MSVRNLIITDVSLLQVMLFDRISIDIKFQSNLVPICDAKFYEFEYIQNSKLMRKTINMKIKIPPNYYKCLIYVHASIINMKTVRSIIELELEENQTNIEIKNIMIQTELGSVVIGIQKQEENYLGSIVDSEISSSTMTICEVQSSEGIESEVELYDGKLKQQLTENERQSQTKKFEGHKNNFVKGKRNHQHFFSDSNFNTKKIS